MRINTSIFSHIILSIIIILYSSPSEGAKIRIYKELKDSIKTNILGTSETFPPYVKVIRSKEGVEYMLREFRQIRNYSGFGKVKVLEKELKKINFERYMLIAVMTQPVDNYSLKITKAQINNRKKRLELTVRYNHTNRAYNIPPKKSIYYHMIAVKKSGLPVMLDLIKNSKRKKKEKAPKSVYVTGRLLYWKYSDLQLVPVKIKKRKSIIYYIKGRQVKKVEKYVGRVVTLKGTIVRDQNSPYEKDLNVEKVVKIIEKL